MPSRTFLSKSREETKPKPKLTSVLQIFLFQIGQEIRIFHIGLLELKQYRSSSPIKWLETEFAKDNRGSNDDVTQSCDFIWVFSTASYSTSLSLSTKSLVSHMLWGLLQVSPHWQASVQERLFLLHEQWPVVQNPVHPHTIMSSKASGAEGRDIQSMLMPSSVVVHP